MKILLSLILFTRLAVAAPGDLKWTFTTQGPIRSSPALGTNGWILFGSYDGNVYAVDPLNGQVHWQALTAGRLVSSPAVTSEGLVIIGTTNGLVALNGLTGTTQASFDPGPSFTRSVLSTPSIGANGEIYFATERGVVFSVTPNFNSVLWTNSPAGPSLIAFYSSPTIGRDGTVFIGTTGVSFIPPFFGRFYVLNSSNGTPLWSLAGENWFQSTASIDEDGTVYISGKDRVVYALDPLTGTTKWTNVLGDGMTSSPVIGLDKTLYIGADDGRLYALDTSTGKQKWRFLTRDSIHSTPATAADGTVYFGSYDKNVYALDGRTGELKWSFTTDGFVLSSPLIGPDGTIYIGSFDGKLYAFAGSAPLASTAWPMFKANPRHTGAAPR